MQIACLHLILWPLCHVSHEHICICPLFAGWMAAEGQGKPYLAAQPPDAAITAIAANASWLEDCIVRTVCVLALDRFADYVSDQVFGCSDARATAKLQHICQLQLAKPKHFDQFAQAVAPVRETAAQALGAAVQPLSSKSLRVLLGLLQTLANCEQWEVRHSGLLALKYVVAARPDTAAQLLPLVVNIATAGLKVQYLSEAAT
jgi:TATA-binding protein-associated factor